MAFPPSKVINAFEHSTQNKNVLDLAKEFDIDSANIQYIQVPASEQFKASVAQQTVHFVFVVKGSGDLKIGSEQANLKSWDFFGFPSMEERKDYEIVAGSEGIALLQISDKEGSNIPITIKPPGTLPSIVNANAIRKAGAKGALFCNFATMTRMCDISATPKQDNLWNANIEWVPPGCKTSKVHAHSHEDELAFMLEGNARYWHHGEEPAPILKPGDCVGWKAGTGIAHNLINDGEGPNGEGDWFSYIIWGGDLPDTDKCYYPDHSDNRPPEWKWVPKEIIPWGKASKEPKYPKPDDYTG